MQLNLICLVKQVGLKELSDTDEEFQYPDFRCKGWKRSSRTNNLTTPIIIYTKNCTIQIIYKLANICKDKPSFSGRPSTSSTEEQNINP